MDRLPLLPGYKFNDPSENQFHVSHTLNYKNGYALPRTAKLGKGRQPLDADSVSYLDLDKWCWDPNLTYGEPRGQDVCSGIEPKYVKFASKALAFQAYSVEPKQGPLDELPRIRHVLLFYHLEDDTVSVMEPAIQNSGFVQGKVLRRHRIPKRPQDSELNEDQPFWHWKDLNVGADVWLYGRVYHLASCDSFTREFLTSQGIEVGDQEHIPPDPFTSLQQQKALRQARALEKSDEVSNTELDKLGRFLVFDRQVLRFFAAWQDPDDPRQEVRMFRVHFYLADGTVEVRPEYKPNDGHYHYPALISRQLLPKTTQPVNFPSLAEAEYYCPEDLRVGSDINVLGRSLLLYDCDGFTREYYRARLGINQPEAVNVQPQAERYPVMELPPHNGIGSPEDSLQSCLRLVPRAPRPPHSHLDPERPLRYSLRLDSERPADQPRSFVLCYGPCSGQITITELPGKNTGVLSGRFLGPKKLIKPQHPPPIQPDYYGPADFSIGGVVDASGYRFIITGADLYVYHYVQARRGHYRSELIENLRTYVQHQGLLSAEFNDLSANTVTKDEKPTLKCQ